MAGFPPSIGVLEYSDIRTAGPLPVGGQSPQISGLSSEHQSTSSALMERLGCSQSKVKTSSVAGFPYSIVVLEYSDTLTAGQLPVRGWIPHISGLSSEHQSKWNEMEVFLPNNVKLLMNVNLQNLMETPEKGKFTLALKTGVSWINFLRFFH